MRSAGAPALLTLILALSLSACAAPRLADFERSLAAQDSATAALGDWCAAHHIADPPTIRALPVAGAGEAPPPGLRAELEVSSGEPLGYRHVRLACGDAVLSEAHNWFVPSRLTPAMNATLAHGDVPFGKVVAPLRFRRERLASTRGRAPGCPPGTVLSHRALLRLPDGRPISALIECYTPANLGR